MAEIELVDLGSAKLDEKTNVLLAQAKTTQVGQDPNDAPDIGDAPIMAALGLTAFPAPANENGRAQGIKVDAPGTNGVIVGARDSRCAQVVAELAPGETCLHSTGADFDSRVFCKDKVLALVVGKKMAVTLDEREKKLAMSAFGAYAELSADGGAYLAHGGAMIQVKDGNVIIKGKLLINNATVPLIGGVSAPGAPIPGCFAG